MLTMAKEHSERITQLQTRLEHMNIEAEQQKTLVLQQKHKERERLDKINELQAMIDQYQLEKTKKEHEFRTTQENLQLAESKLNQLEAEKSDLHLKLEEQHQENKKLIEIIDRQKFDLDEARTNVNRSDQVADYSKKIQVLESERNQYHQQVIQQENIIHSLSTEFNKQHEIIHTIQEDILLFTKHKATKVITVIAWIFLLYHILLLILTSFYLGSSKTISPNPSFYFMKQFSEWYTSYF